MSAIDASTNHPERMGDLLTMEERNPATLKKLDRMRLIASIFTAISVALFALTIVFIGLAQANYTHPLIPLYTLSGSVVLFGAVSILHCVSQSIAKKGGINLETYQEVKEPIPKKKKKKDPETPKNEES